MVEPCRTEGFEALHFSLNVVGLDVDVHALLGGFGSLVHMMSHATDSQASDQARRARLNRKVGGSTPFRHLGDGRTPDRVLCWCGEAG